MTWHFEEMLVILYPVLLFFLAYILLNTRFIDSISSLFLYSEMFLKKLSLAFGVQAYGLEEAAGLPGLLNYGSNVVLYLQLP